MQLEQGILEYYTALWATYDMAAQSFFKLTGGATRLWLIRRNANNETDLDGQCYETVHQMAIKLWRDFVFLKLVSCKGSLLVWIYIMILILWIMYFFSSCTDVYFFGQVVDSVVALITTDRKGGSINSRLISSVAQSLSNMNISSMILIKHIKSDLHSFSCIHF